MYSIINENEIGILFRNGKFQKILRTGEQYFTTWIGEFLEVHKLINLIHIQKKKLDTLRWL